MRRSTLRCLAVLLLLTPLAAQGRVPGERWMSYAAPEQAGWSPDLLEEAHGFWEPLESAAFLVVENGVVVVAWGDVDRRYMCHSTRKSLMSGMWGVYHDAGKVDIERTLAELGIDDQEPKLTDVEKTAKIHDLLKARSGVYRLAAYEPPQNPKPPRGSHAPGTWWCYNNWDFNTLVTIFEQETGKKFFDDFEVQFGKPLGMQDYRPRDGYYHYERDKSSHPAYPFKLSARDMARYGLLYLYEGSWDDQRILSKKWVDASRTSYSDTGRGGYGYMWWISGDPRVKPFGMYSALGYGGHSIDVIPGKNLVVVNRVDTYLGRDMPESQRLTLIDKIFAAKTGEAEAAPKLVPLEESIPLRAPLPPIEKVAKLVGTYEGEVFGTIELVLEDGVLLLREGTGNTFTAFPQSDTLLRIEDLETLVLLTEHPADGSPGRFKGELDFFYIARQHLEGDDSDAAMAALEEGLELFPASATLHVAMASICIQEGDTELARSLCTAALEIDPRHESASDLLLRLEKK